MKKKVLLVVIVLVLALCCFAACNNYDETLAKINGYLEADYSEVKINVVTTVSGTDLLGEYTLTFQDNGKVVVEYIYEVLNDISINGDNSFKRTVFGTVEVQNGVVVSGQEDLSNVPLTFSGFSFKRSFFNNIVVTKSAFQADVRTPAGFIGNTDFSCDNMHVIVFLGQNSLNRMDLSYTKGGADVKIVYTFTA